MLVEFAKLTTAVSTESETTLYELALMFPIVTVRVSVKPEPLIVITVPDGPEVGVNEVIIG